MLRSDRQTVEGSLERLTKPISHDPIAVGAGEPVDTGRADQPPGYGIEGCAEKGDPGVRRHRHHRVARPGFPGWTGRQGVRVRWWKSGRALGRHLRFP